MLLSRDLNEPRESAECWSGLNEYHVVGTDTEKARDANMDILISMAVNNWALTLNRKWCNLLTVTVYDDLCLLSRSFCC